MKLGRDELWVVVQDEFDGRLRYTYDQNTSHTFMKFLKINTHI